jgi:uncharacterized membrane protein
MLSKEELMVTEVHEASSAPATAASPLPNRSRAHIHLPKTFGEQAADAIANGMGSWRFIIIQTIFVASWIVLNFIGLMNHWDPYPFILLNLLFSTQAAYAAPIIMMSQNRQAQKDHIRDDHEAEEVDLLYQINQQQLEILQLLRLHLGADASAEEITAARAAARALDQKMTSLQAEVRNADQETERH